MKDYIERAAILQAIEESEPDVMADYGEYYGSEWGFSRSKLSEIIRGMPAAYVVEVRHGRWMTTDAYPHHLYCSVCYKTYAKNAKWVNELDLPTNYCPNCGARMDKEDEHEVS